MKLSWRHEQQIRWSNIPKSSIDLLSQSFSHGQLYVGLDRIGNSETQHILLPQNQTP